MQSVIQNISSVASAINVVILAVGYYFMVKLYREWIVQSEEERTAGGRPMVVVAAGYEDPPHVSLVVQNFNAAPAKDVTFEFSAPVEDSEGYVLSDLPYLREGMPFLAPEEKIGCYWDALPALINQMKEKGLKDGIAVTTRYKDLAGESYETEWRLTRCSSTAPGSALRAAWTTSSARSASSRRTVKGTDRAGRPRAARRPGEARADERGRPPPVPGRAVRAGSRPPSRHTAARAVCRGVGSSEGGGSMNSGRRDVSAGTGLPRRTSSWLQASVSLLVGVAAALALAPLASPSTCLLAGWDVAALVYLAWAWRISWPRDAGETRRLAGRTRLARPSTPRSWSPPSSASGPPASPW